MARRVVQFLVVLSLVTQIALPGSFIQSGAKAFTVNVPPLGWTPTFLPPSNPQKLNDLEKAYLDVFSILKEDNACSRYYGGAPAISALNELIAQLHPTYIDRTIAIRMSGRTTLFQSNLTKFSFRVFDKAEINLAGAFYKGNGPFERRIPLIGSLQPNTRASRIVVLLHELGHMVHNVENQGQWLLPDDGSDQKLSLDNTEVVLKVCRKDIDAIERVNSAQLLLNSGGAERSEQAVVRTAVSQL
jgi:hypothetical protein